MRHRASLLFFAFTTTVLGLCGLWIYRDNERLKSDRDRLLAELDTARSKRDDRLEEFEKRLAGMMEKIAERDAEHTAAWKSVGEKIEALDTAATKKAGGLEALTTRAEESAKALAELTSRLDALTTDPALREDMAGLKSEIEAVGATVRALEGTLAGKLAALDRAAEASAEERRKLARALIALEESLAGGPSAATTDGTTEEASRPPPEFPVETTVERVDLEDGIVVVGAGREAGLEEGHDLFVLREGALVARLRVLTTYAAMAGAEIRETTAGMEPRAGDRVTSVPPAGGTGKDEAGISSVRERIGPPPPPPPR